MIQSCCENDCKNNLDAFYESKQEPSTRWKEKLPVLLVSVSRQGTLCRLYRRLVADFAVP